MKFYVINDNDKSVAVVAYEYFTGSVYCRSNKKSFNQAFNAVCNKMYYSSVKDNNVYRINFSDLKSYNWIEGVLDIVCKNRWFVKERGEVLNIESEIDDLVYKYLSS